MITKKVGIVVDNWKLSTFKKELNKAGHNDLLIQENIFPNVSAIQITVAAANVGKLSKLIKTIDFNVKNSN